MELYNIKINKGMEQIRYYIEGLLAGWGMQGAGLYMACHVIMVLLAVAVAWLSFMLFYRGVVPVVLRLTKKTSALWDDVLFSHATLLSVCRIVPAVAVWVMLPHIFYRYPDVKEALTRITAIYIIIMSMRLGLVMTDALRRIETERHATLQQYYHTFCGVLKIAIIFVAVIVMVAVAINRSPLTLFAGLGATSAILMLVFKDTISGLVAGIRLTSNDMLQKGDWITVPKADINGVVEDITLTTVKVRNFDRTILTITPQALVDGSFQNWRGMQTGDGRRVARRVFFDFRHIAIADSALKERLAAAGYLKAVEMRGESTNMTLFRRYVERYLAGHKDVNSDMLFMVRQLEATDAGLPLEFYFFLKQKEWKPYEHQLAAIMEHIYAVCADFGLKVYQRYSDCAAPPR